MAPEVRCATGTIAEIAEALRDEARRCHRRGTLLAKVADMIAPSRPKPQLRYEPRQRGGKS